MNSVVRRRTVKTDDMVPKIANVSPPLIPGDDKPSPRLYPTLDNRDGQVVNGTTNYDLEFASLRGEGSVSLNHSSQHDRGALRTKIDTETHVSNKAVVDYNQDGNVQVTGGITDVDVCDDEICFDADSDRTLLLPVSEVRRPLFASMTPDTDDVGDQKKDKDEKSISIAFQVFLPFLVAGLGTVAAGLLLDVVQHWDVFKEVSEVFILVPALLGLKGNLEMTLASRLSTAANIGNMDCAKRQTSLIVGNMVLVQAQALVVAALASMAAVLFGWVLDGKFDIHHATLLCASSLMTASLASAILGGIMVGVILLSRKLNINPDNVATPIAASLGDLTTLALLAGISSFLFNAIGSHHWIAPLLSLLCVILLPLWLYISHHNQFTHNVLYTGWSPVIMAMCISSGGGLILSYIVERYHGIAVFNPVINGVGGNLVAVQASRISTHLHKVSKLGILPAGVQYGCLHSFCVAGGHARTARVLLFMAIPGHAIFLCIISYLKAGHTSVTTIFTVSYLIVGFVQVFLLLFFANWMVHWMWKNKKDPDNFSIPYLTALGDLLGTFLLAVAFHVLWLVGDRDADVGD